MKDHFCHVVMIPILWKIGVQEPAFRLVSSKKARPRQRGQESRLHNIHGFVGHVITPTNQIFGGIPILKMNAPRIAIPA